MRQAMIVNAFEIAELGDQFSTRADDYNFISLIGGNPEIVVTIYRDAVCAVDAVDEDRRFAGSAIADRDLNDSVISGVGNEQNISGMVEFNSVRAKRRDAGGGQQRIADPNCPRAAARPSLPDDSLEGI